MITKAKWRKAIRALHLLRVAFDLISRPLILYILLYKECKKDVKGNNQDGRSPKPEDILPEQLVGTIKPIFIRNIDHSVIKRLLGDSFFERNIADIIKLESDVGQSILDIFDTHPIFEYYPHLRGLARNKEFEEAQAKKRQAQKKTKTR